MASVDRQINLKFTQPFNQILTMLILVGMVAVGTYLVYPSIAPIFSGISVFKRLHHHCVSVWPDFVLLAGFDHDQIRKLD